MSLEPSRRIIVIDDNAAIHADFLKILAPETAEADGDLEAMAASLFGAEKPAAERLRYHVSTASQGQEGAELVQQAFRQCE
jgi:CheY-like chemotaxis protein